MKFHSLFFVAAATTPTGTSAIEADDAKWNSKQKSVIAWNKMDLRQRTWMDG